MSSPAIEVTGLTRRYGQVPALDNLSLTLAPGRIVGLFGENGSGKTTLFKILAGVLAEYTGRVRIAGFAPGPESKARVSFLPDQSYLPDQMSTASAMAMFTDFFADFDAARAAALVDSFRIDRRRKLKSLSRGQREKVQLALAMSRRAEVYLLDEPISGIAPAARDTILDTILRSYSPDALVIISTHLLADIEPVADTAVFLSRGRVLMAGDADDLRTEHGMSLDHLFRTTYATPVRS